MYNIDILTKAFDFVDEMDEAIVVSLYKDQIIFVLLWLSVGTGRRYHGCVQLYIKV